MLKKIVTVFACLVCCCLFNGCFQQKTQSVRGGLVTGTFQDAYITAKDFEPVSLVFAETVINNASSSVMTYDALLKEAHKLGAHAIINVVIEDVRICESDSFSSACVTTRYGSALAIKYTNVVSYPSYLSRPDFFHPVPVSSDSPAHATNNSTVPLFGNVLGGN